jgi:hypothetical protein
MPRPSGEGATQAGGGCGGNRKLWSRCSIAVAVIGIHLRSSVLPLNCALC